MERNELMDKIRKLLALSKSPNEHEAVSAATKAEELMEKYGIRVLTVEVERKNVSEQKWGITKTTAAWMVSLFQGVAKIRDLKTYWWKPTQQMMAIGCPADIEVAGYLYNFLRRATQELCMDFEEDHGRFYDVNDRRSYCKGVTDRVIVRLQSEKDIRIQASMTCRDLVVRKDSLINNFLVERKYQVRNARGPSHARLNGKFYEEGYSDGSKIEIHQAVGQG